MAGSSLYEGWHSASTVLADNVYLSGDSIYAIAEGSSWTQAQASAERLGGNLVTINSADENIYVYKNFGFEDDVAISSGYWIGLTDQAEEGNWKWSSGEISDWTPYGWGLAGHEPNGNGDHAWVKVGFDTPGISYEEAVSGSNDHWLSTEQPLWEARGPGWDDTWETGEGTNYGVAEIPFIRRGGSAYITVEGPTWEEAKANAIELGGYLSSITSKEEYDFLLESNLKGWIGLSNPSNSGTVNDDGGRSNWGLEGFEWESGENYVYEDWMRPVFNSDGNYVHFGDVHGGNTTMLATDNDLSSHSNVDWWDGLGIAEIHLFDFELSYQLNSSTDSGLSQNAVLGDSIDTAASYTLEITGESLRDGYRVESADITLSFDTVLFNDIQASDIRIGGAMPIANAVDIDNEAGTIRIAASSLSDLFSGTGIDGETLLASINLDFDETALETIEKNSDGSLKTNPLSFSLSANSDETVFSKTFIDDTGQLNRDIVTLGDLGGYVAVEGQDVTLYEAKINLAQQGEGLVLGTQRVIGSDASITNLVRSGDTLTTSAEWLNVGNIQANNLSYESLYNQNASLVSADFSKSSIASGSFIDGVFVNDARESTVLTTDIKITGEAGNVVDLADGIVSVQADAEGSDSFSNAGKGSKNLITFQGDLNYDGRVSMKDLAYLNAGAARQQLVEGTDENGNAVQVASEASYARDVDADFSGKIDLADLSVLDADWGKSLHTGDEQFQGSADVSWSELDSQGTSSTWENDSFKGQNAIEADSGYVGSLESPTAAGVIGADGNTTANDNDITGTEFQDQIPA